MQLGSDAKNLFILTKNLIATLSGFWLFKPIKFLLLLAILGGLLTLILNYFFPVTYVLPYSRLVYDQDSVLLHAYLASDDKWRFETNLNDLSPEYLKALLTKEDNFYYYHLGVNPLAVFRAAFHNVLRQKRISGASTITMQVVRLLEPRERTWKNKIIEMVRAWQLETILSKTEILKLYINLIPFGGNIEGIRAASFFYFQKHPKNLSVAQWSLFTVIPNQPNSLRLGKNNQRIKQARDFWMRYYHQKGYILKADLINALEEPIESSAIKRPTFAPHIARFLTQKNTNQSIIYSTIQLKEQQKVEQIVSNYKRRISPLIQNIAVCVLNNQTHKITAYVGSHSFFDQNTQGQVDGVRAYRSPGSTLKPFLYSLAIDEGLITPQKKLLDLPFEYLGYQPENFDGNVSGWVTVSEALSRSLNLPAIRLLVSYGQNRFIEKLSDWKFSKIAKRKKDLGLSIILGGCEVSLLELVTAYSTFANQGYYYPVIFTSSDSLEKPKQIISSGAAWIIAEILSDADRPDLPIQFGAKTLPRIAWKTGTSYGRKDAWAVGFTPQMTVGVWLGNFTGEGIADLQGNRTATPLLFDLLIALSQQTSGGWFIKPDAVISQKVCALSGESISNKCKSFKTTWMLDNAISTSICQYEQIFRVSTNRQIRYCNACCPTQNFIWDTITTYPPELNSWLLSQNLTIPKIPIHNPLCGNIVTESPPKIVSPADRTVYTALFQETIQLKVAAAPKSTANTYFWYLNNLFIRQAASHEEFFISPPVGSNTLTCQDELGNTTTVQFEVKAIK